MKYEVPYDYRVTGSKIVEADSPEEAEALVKEMLENNDNVEKEYEVYEAKPITEKEYKSMGPLTDYEVEFSVKLYGISSGYDVRSVEEIDQLFRERVNKGIISIDDVIDVDEDTAWVYIKSDKKPEFNIENIEYFMTLPEREEND